MGERMSSMEIAQPSSSAYGHKARYHLAAGYLLKGDRVLDAACGIGYGSKILSERGSITYHGVDKEFSDTMINSEGITFSQADLTEWEPEEDFDIFVGYETIEHLPSYNHYLEMAKRASRLLFLSAPVIPTKHINQWHLHDFAPGELVGIVEDENWHCIQALGQPSEFSEIYIFKK